MTLLAPGAVLWTLADDPALIPGSPLMREWSDLNGLPRDDCAVEGLCIIRDSTGTHIEYRHLLGKPGKRTYGLAGQALYLVRRVPLRLMPPGM